VAVVIDLAAAAAVTEAVAEEDVRRTLFKLKYTLTTVLSGFFVKKKH
jgi:hypothetical protein